MNLCNGTIAFAAAAAWNSFFPEMSSESAAVVGAAVFLGVSLKMPLTAIAFILELTYAPVALLMPLCTDNFAAKRMNRNIQRALTGQSVDNI